MDLEELKQRAIGGGLRSALIVGLVAIVFQLLTLVILRESVSGGEIDNLNIVGIAGFALFYVFPAWLFAFLLHRQFERPSIRVIAAGLALMPILIPSVVSFVVHPLRSLFALMGGGLLGAFVRFVLGFGPLGAPIGGGFTDYRDLGIAALLTGIAMVSLFGLAAVMSP